MNITNIILLLILKYKVDYEYKIDYSNSLSDTNSKLLQKANEDQYFGAVIAAGITVSFQIFRVLLRLQASKTFGPLIKIIQLMIKNVMQFGIILWLILLIFIVLGRVIFNKVQDFRSYEGAIKYLFNAALGNFDFETFDVYNNNYKYYGYFYLVTYIILIAITLLNFLIAILSSTYDEYRNKSTGVYLNHVVHTKRKFEYDRYYSSLMYSYNPLIIITFPFLIFLSLKKWKVLNKIIMHALYFPVAVISTLAFVLISLIWAPISFILFVLTSLRRTFSKQIEMPWYHIVIYIFVSIIFGIPFQIIKTIKDTINFAISLYETNLKRKYIDEVDEGIFEKLDLDFVQCFLNFLEREYSDCDEYVSSSKIIKEIRDQFEVVDQISRLLYWNSILFNKIEVQKELNEIKAGL